MGASLVDGSLVHCYNLIDNLACFGFLCSICLKNPMLGDFVHFVGVVAESLCELLGESIAILFYELLHWEHVDIDVGVSGIVYAVPGYRQAG